MSSLLRATAPAFMLPELNDGEEGSSSASADRNGRRRQRHRKKKAAAAIATPAASNEEPEKSVGADKRTVTKTNGSIQNGQTFQSSSGVNLSEDKTNKRTSRPRRGRRIHEQPGDIVSRLIRDLTLGTYECMICCESVKAPHYVWSCSTCWAVFHLKCIRKWASASNKKSASAWRCPGCQSARGGEGKDSDLNLYWCWCGKVETPLLDKHVSPHGCSNKCERQPRPGCPHGCQMSCHPGPCPECPEMAPSQSCYCGDNSRVIKCCEADFGDIGWSCDQICGRQLSCPSNERESLQTKHKCRRVCHPGECGQCEVVISGNCYCHKHSKDLNCYERKNMPSLDGVWKCESVCGNLFDCGVHACTQICCAHKSGSNECPLSPSQVSRCPCGGVAMADLCAEQGVERSTCTSPILTCDNMCDAKLQCGHACKSKCHSGIHAKCEETIAYTCACGNFKTNVTCQNYLSGNYEKRCGNICGAKLSCERHECLNQCCSGKRAAFARQAKKKKKWTAVWDPPRHNLNSIESEHICLKVCGRKLKCGAHYCSVLCHDGPCPSCIEASFDPLICHCGLTQVQPPIRCGAKLPPCPNACVRLPPCGHPSIDHHCHPDSESCPPCPYFVSRLCRCKKTTVHNQACYKSVAYCHMKCDTVLSCGFHHCAKVCHDHTAGENTCTEICGKKKKICGHRCQTRCHSPFECNETNPCTEVAVKLCACGRQSKKMQCGACIDNSETWRHISCNDDCARAKRNTLLAAALEIDEGAQEEIELYDEYVYDTFKEHRQFAISIEQQFLAFLQAENKRLAFKPMRQPQRKFIHALAKAFHLSPQSLDPEPQRSVEVHKTTSTEIPSRSIATAVLMRRTKSMVYPKADARPPLVSGKGYNCLYLERLAVGTLRAQLEVSLLPILQQLNFPVKISVSFCASEALEFNSF